ncbi:MAG TPA: 3-methyl-2-oxobutanoate hydroxymethyltransferase [bacterium]|nr:3-methyl-2-oxobutanoate hydroxymethyltransferase [bacterium]HPN32682.1 3-methyl-2-oxobutanoate hydroxymethyltransferase [bacterium]
MKKTTIENIKQKKIDGRKISVLTAYDYTTAKIIDSCDIDIILIGDSVANTMLGYDSTIPVTIDEILYHTKMVSKAVVNSMILADMPFMSYQASEEEGVRNAGRLVKEGRANAVKLEGGKELSSLIKRLSEIGIPVSGHIGLTPQYINNLGGYKVQGKTKDKINILIEDALALQEAGAFMIVFECIPEEVSQIITSKLDVPSIGIGAGKYCDGQVLVINDILGLSGEFRPKFVKQYVDLSVQIKNAVSSYKREIEESLFPDSEHSFHISKEILINSGLIK